MSPEELALFPFLTETSEYVEELDFSLDSLMTSIAFESVRRRGFERVMQAFEGEVSKPSFGNDKEVLSELLSYPYARILVSCVSEPAFTRRYALAEATAAHSIMKKTVEKDPDFVLDIGRDFGISAALSDEHIRIYFSDYIRYSLSMKDLSWKLINRHMEHGYVTIQREEFARLLQEAIRKRIEGSLPVPEIPDEIREACESQVAELKAKYEEQRQNLGDADLGEVDFSMFPPCINKALSNVREGVNLAHSMRFALVSFLLNVGMQVDDVVNVFNISPDFSEEKTRYQVEHIANNQYKTPACATMQTYGNCAGRDNMCAKIRHPLGYYSALKFLAAKRQAEEEKFGKDEETESKEKTETETVENTTV
ncbi:hypothetical protein MmiAt1_16420 [Methanimicrococcus sp. At1]|uniref:DNA primase large subunit PriL n=1 Tax=Methanimicrococcus hacksteinii TaxID=3028293 RepID=A0ABU3VRI9_9EURY|nr:DNA primase regulatory subunit PriL [Methanimicrococcus sp. At1]MDV0446032.1 hypothetical protein [Methanimicrococcus sp. At1]